MSLSEAAASRKERIDQCAVSLGLDRSARSLSGKPAYKFTGVFVGFCMVPLKSQRWGLRLTVATV